MNPYAAQVVHTLAWNHGDPNAAANLNNYDHTMRAIAASHSEQRKASMAMHPAGGRNYEAADQAMGNAYVHDMAATEHSVRAYGARHTATRGVTQMPKNKREAAHYN